MSRLAFDFSEYFFASLEKVTLFVCAWFKNSSFPDDDVFQGQK